MHSVLLLHRSLVLAAVTNASAGHDGSGSSRRGSGGSGGVVSIDQVGGGGVSKGLDETEIDTRSPKWTHDHRSNAANVGGTGGSSVIDTKASISEDLQWAAAQASADAAAVAAAAEGKKKAAMGSSGHDAGGVSERGGDLSVKTDGSGSAGVKALTPEQLQSARDIAGQLDTEVRCRHVRPLHFPKM